MTEIAFEEIEVGNFSFGNEEFDQLSVFLISFEYDQSPIGASKRKELQYEYSASIAPDIVKQETYTAICEFKIMQSFEEKQTGYLIGKYLMGLRVPDEDKIPSKKYTAEYVASSIWPRFIALGRMVQGLGFLQFPRFPTRPESIAWHMEDTRVSAPKKKTGRVLSNKPSASTRTKRG